MESQHTPGPWHVGDPVHEFKDGSNWRIPVWADNGPEYGKIAAEATCPDREMGRANARLIAAAPHMYLAFCTLRDMFKGDEHLYPSIVNVINHAIAKAEGR